MLKSAFQRLLVALLCLPFASAGSFLSGSIRWRVSDQSTYTVEIDVVSYWSRSFSTFQSSTLAPPVVGDVVELQAQSTVQLRFGDGSEPAILKGMVTNINEEEDWIEVVASVPHSYRQGFEYKFINENSLYTETQFHYVPWKVTFEGCCRYSGLQTDSNSAFNITSAVLVDGTVPFSPDPRILPKIYVPTGGLFTVAAVVQDVSYIDASSSTPPLQWQPCANTHLPAFTRLDANTGDIKWDVTTPGLYHLCINVSLKSQPTVYSDVDFLVYSQALPSPIHIDTDFSSVLKGFVNLNFNVNVLATIDPTMINTGDQIGFEVGFVSPMTNGPLAPGAGQFTVAQIASGSAEATLKITVQPSMHGWNSFCFVAYVIDRFQKIGSVSTMKCSNAYFYASDNIRMVATAAEQNLYKIAGQTEPNHFVVPEGVQLRVSISAWMEASSAAVERSMVADLNGNGVLEEPEVQIFYGNRPRPLGATLTTVSANTSILLYEPPREYAGADIELCINAKGVATAAALSQGNELCLTIMVQKCVWTVRTGESFITIAQNIGISWLQLWNFNKGNYSRPDIDLRTGDQVRVGQLYRVDSGDTLYNVADRFSSTVPILYALNGGLDPLLAIYPGQLICIAFSACAQT